MIDRRKNLRFIWERERDEIDKIISKIDFVDDSAINEIFTTDRRDGVKKRSKKLIKFF